MALFLVQHGESLPKEQGPERGLSDAGIATVIRIACIAMNQDVVVDRILHSGKARARQTAEIMAKALPPQVEIRAETGLNPMDDVQAYGAGLNNKDRLMLVGHLPFMARLTSYLVTGSPETQVCQFQNGGIVCLDQVDAAENWLIRWMLVPRID